MKDTLLNRYKIGLIGLFSMHEENVIIDRPEGSGDYLFLYFPREVEILDETGKHITQAAGCIIYPPTVAQWYKTEQGSMLHHFIHFKGEAIEELLSYTKLPLNKVFYPHDTLFICQLVSQLLTEKIIKTTFHTEVSNSFFEALMLKLGRAIKFDHDKTLNDETHFNLTRLKTIRKNLENDPLKKWSIQELASEIHMSNSHFHTIYKQVFGTSPMRDLESFRMRIARRTLIDTNKSISQVALLCGYNNVYYFSNVFKKYHGSSPKIYRRAIIGERNTQKNKRR